MGKNIGNLYCLLIIMVWILGASCGCLNGCSSRGLCINNVCVCADGLTGADCSVLSTSSNPTLSQCPSCYTLTVGAPRYYTGPTWNLPDGPIVALNYQGALRMYQGNGDGEMISDGLNIDDWLPTSVVALKGGVYSAGQFDMCGSWIMRAFADPIVPNKVLGFYHAERSCNYSNGGQTRKSAGYAVSADGGYTFTKPGYPTNKLVDTSSPVTTGIPSGEGDISVLVRGNYFYMFFNNVEQWYTGVARATIWSEGYPGAFQKYYYGQWNQSAVGGLSSRLNGITGTQVYLHTPSQSFVAIGNAHPYWGQNFMLSTSDDAVNWNLLADPLMPVDKNYLRDQFSYGSLMGPTGGYEFGGKSSLFYMWGTASARYQVIKQVTLTYVGPNATNVVGTKIALTTFRSSTTGETWQTTELPLSPYNTVNYVGYMMSRAYPNTFPIYDCLNVANNDHFVGTAAECFNVGSSVTVTRAVGYVYPVRMPGSIAVYRCSATNDKFLSSDINCEGRAAPQTTVFAYFLDGPAITNTEKGYSVIIPKGSTWKYTTTAMTDPSWTTLNFADGNWPNGSCPFGSGYASRKTYFGPTNYFFRTTFYITPGNTVQKLFLSVASDDHANVYINGVLVDSDPASWHEATYWNRRVYVPNTMLLPGLNQISVQVFNGDNWSMFDLELSAKYADSLLPPPLVCSPTCANGQCVSGVCVCDNGWSGAACDVNKCSYSNSVTQMVLSQNSTYLWTESNAAPIPPGWFAINYDDTASRWTTGTAPFATTFYYSGFKSINTVVPLTPHLFRKKFMISALGRSIVSATLSIMSDDTHYLYVNGNVLSAQVYPYNGHYATQWSQVLTIPGSLLIDGMNQVAVEIPQVDGRWSQYFEMQIQVTFATKTCLP